MANILDNIIATKFEEIKESQKIKSLDQLQDEVKNASQPRGFVKAIETHLKVLSEKILIQKRLPSPMKKVGQRVCLCSQINNISRATLII
jgi:indole-3-glycerol phosphate synthase